MTLEEAKVSRDACRIAHNEAPIEEKEERWLEWHRAYLKVKLLLCTPTQQLCAVARKIAEQDKNSS